MAIESYSIEELEKRYKPEMIRAYPAGISAFLAIISGILLSASQDLNLPGAHLIAFIGFVPLLIATDHKRPITTFFLAFTAFFISLVNPLWWAAQYGAFAVIGLVVMESILYSFAFVLYNFIRERSNWRDPFLIKLPMLIVVVEFFRTIGPWAFPWTMIGHSQYANLAFIQGASIWGLIGISFLIIWINRGVYLLVNAFPHNPGKLVRIIPLVIVLIFNQLYGISRLKDESYMSTPGYPVTIAQRATDTYTTWTTQFNLNAWNEFHNLTRPGIEKNKDRPGFVLWPENAIPDLVQYRLPTVQNLADTYKKVFIIGTVTYSPEPVDFSNYDEPWFKIYNSVASVVPGDGLTGVYSKVHLVPFGETLPMRDHLAILEYPWGDKNLSEGRSFANLPTPYGDAGAMICYESFFPQISRKFIRDGAKFLFMASNTSWFGDSIATWQHARYDIFRSIENGCYFARAATTGVSSIIDPRGRVVHETQPFVGEAFTEDIHPISEFTIYTHLGDWIAYVSMIWLILTLMVIFRPGTAKPIRELLAYVEE